MNYTKPAFLFSIFATSILLVLAYSLEQYWAGALMVVIMGFLSLFGFYRQKWSWSNDLFFIGTTILIIIGVLFGFKLYLLLPALLGSLASWDLGRFQQRLGDEPASETISQIEKRHLFLLALALVIGCVFAAMVLTFQVQVSFGLALILGITLIISLTQIYRMLQN